jgi:hypothetical protein
LRRARSRLWDKAKPAARTIINQTRHKGDMDRRVLGAFLEHLGRAVYEGVYDPKSPLADANGFRKARALAEQERRESLRVLLGDLIAEHGEPAAKDVKWAERALAPRRD